MVTRVLVVDRHQLMIDTLDAWLRCNAPDLVIKATSTALLPSEQGSGWAAEEIEVAVLGTLDSQEDLLPAVRHLVRAGLRVVVLAAVLDGWDAGAACTAGALGYVPKAAGPQHIEHAIRAVAAGKLYVPPEVAAVMVDTAPERIKLSLREQRLAELYLGSDALPVRGVADAMGISEQTVKAHLHRIRQRYAAAGIRLSNVISLRNQLSADGWIT
ncbi:response regulator transcription factor [Paenarthrobacter sp. UW852]|uniref:response regulator transcription factor n=1 Tax=Paenarthrobacter sp. UW852 TaxID=2951989 RepID=UPI002147E491|nr:response regulator transcription factor [Paenarthrobacter sp. UW852]MCR1160892.1 response regulator transcription factor [Paenarthrobacter sp. UW852]